MRRRLDLFFAGLGVALIAAYHLMGEGGAAKEYQLWAGRAFWVVLVAWAVVWVGRSFVQVRWHQPDGPQTDSAKRPG